jgi:hypothetical protein
MLGLYLACSFVMLFTYTGQIGEANAYMGMQPWDMPFAGYVVFAIGLPIMAWMAYRAHGRPADFFILFYGTITLTSFLVLHPITGPLTAGETGVGVVILLLPLLMVELFRVIIPAIRIKGLLPGKWVEYALVVALLSVIAMSAAHQPASAGFGLDVSYDRRLEGRDIFTAGSFLAYGLAMAMNGVSPYLGFRAGLYMRPLLLTGALAAVVFFYWLLGVKAPLLYVVAAFGLGVLVRRNLLSQVKYYFLGALLVLGLGVAIEWVMFDGYSAIADYFFRRLFTVQAEVQAYYVRFLMDGKSVPWSWLYGSFDPDFSAAYYVGEHYLGNPETNANTNTFLYELAAKGFLGYVFAIVFVPMLLVLFERLYQSSRNPSYLFLGFIYGLLVVEQAYTVALVSSGVGFLFVFTMLESGFAKDAAASHSKTS